MRLPSVIAPVAAAAATAVLVAALVAAPATAANGDVIKCGKANTWCVAVFHFRDSGAVFFQFAARHMHGRYPLCVTPPQSAEVCHTFTLRRRSDGFGDSRVVFARHFPHSKKGRYTVRWLYHGKQIGPRLPFQV